MFVQQTVYTIEKLVNRIRSGRLALPEFQRDFVWSPTQVVDLLESISREWPIGSLLLLNGPQPFAFRAIDSAPEVFHPELDLYVLDGQQRVTAIFHAIQDVSPFVYFVDFNAADLEADEVILWERRRKFQQRFPTLESRAEAGVALIKDLWQNESFHSWLDLISDNSRRNEFLTFRERRLGGLQSKVYHLLAIELEQGIELEALAKIFETLNKTGVRLNAFDLLVAKLFPSKFYLREQWDLAKTNNELISQFEPDGLEIIKLIALLVRVREGRQFSRGVRQGDVLSLKSDFIINYWDVALKYYVAALEMLPRFGVVSSAQLPSWSMVLGLVACQLAGMSDEETKEWWLSRLRRQTFAQAANTRVVAEFDALASGVASVDEATPQEMDDLLVLPVKANGLLLKGFVALVSLSGASDPVTGRPLSEFARIELLELDDFGHVQRTTQATDFQRVVFVSDEGLKALKRSGGALANDKFSARLEEQGFDLASKRRTSH